MAESPATAEYTSDGLRLTLVAPPDDLAPYLSGYYRTENAEGTVVEDFLPPEEGNLRIGKAEIYEACIGTCAPEPVPAAILSGPTDRVTHMRVSNGVFWGIGVTPAGWARLLRVPADAMANRFEDVRTTNIDPSIKALLDAMLAEPDDALAVAERVTACFRALLGNRPAVESTIHAVHLSLLSEDANSVNALATLAGKTPRTFERFCKRHFGFPARSLLKRQRFLRSLGKYMLDPSMKWVSTLDTHYWDQAHFIRDFKATMGMTPSEYAEMPHPVVRAAVSVTSQRAGVAHQALYRPGAALDE